ncbi:MAG TPA: CsgG/HfaB family protein [Thermoanaerobaculia bacterium]|nr:CsgG/HfaB family protein [Thermoanaerobaculia bacterium]
MKRAIAFAACAVLALAITAPLAGAEAGKKPRIAVLEFTNKADNQWWWSHGADAAQDVFVTELVKSRKFVVVEREKINAIMQEKGLTLSKDIDPKTAMQIGKLLGVNYLLTGAVTEYGVTKKGAHSSGIGGLPSFGVGKKTFVAALNARLINISTGEIVWADEASKEESSVSVSVAGTGGGVEDERMFDKVMKPCIQQLTASLKAADL